MPPAAWTSGSMITAVSSCACAATRSLEVAASTRRRAATARRAASAAWRRTAGACLPPDRRRTSRRTCRRGNAPRKLKNRVRSRLAAIEAILQGHLHRDLDGDRARLREERVRRDRRARAREPRRQRIGRRMREPAEHHVRHARELLGDGGANVRMVVAVACGPPRRDAVDELAAVCEIKPHAVRALDDERRRRGLHLAVRQPQMTQSRHTRR